MTERAGDGSPRGAQGTVLCAERRTVPLQKRAENRPLRGLDENAEEFIMVCELEESGAGDINDEIPENH